MARTFNRERMASHNRETILRHICRRRTISRMELADELGLSRATLTRIADNLLDHGIISEDPIPRAPRDQPRSLLRLNPHWGCIVTVSMVYDLAVGVADLAGELLHQERICGDESRGAHHAAYRDNFDEIIPAAVERVLAAWKGQNILGIGVLSAGYVNADGIIVTSEGLNRRNVDMRQVLSQVTRMPVKVDEEFRLLLQSRLWFEPARDVQSAVALAPGLLGSGGGHAHSVSGRIYRGRNGMAGLPGWLMMPPYEAPSEAWATLPLTVFEPFGGGRGYLTALRANAPAAVELFDLAVKAYGWRLAQVVNYLNPDVVYLYTPYADRGEAFMDRVREAARPFAAAEGLEGMELCFGGQRNDEEHLVAAAMPLISEIVANHAGDSAGATPEATIQFQSKQRRSSEPVVAGGSGSRKGT